MSRHKSNARACPAFAIPLAFSRLLKQEDIPLSRILYLIDDDIIHSGYFRRRGLLHLRNSLLGFLGVPSGSLWIVHTPTDQKQRKNHNERQ